MRMFISRALPQTVMILILPHNRLADERSGLSNCVFQPAGTILFYSLLYLRLYLFLFLFSISIYIDIYMFIVISSLFYSVVFYSVLFDSLLFYSSLE